MHEPPPKTPGIKATLGRAVLRLAGWQVDGGPPPVPRAVVVAAPHTSNWDLVFSLATAWVLGIQMAWVGKKSLFETPVFGAVMRALGGVGVDRGARSDAVKAIARTFEARDELLLLVSPEGTRSKSGHWKTGFYWIAVEAQVPIVLGFVDFGRKRTGLGTVFEPTGDIRADFVRLRAFYKDIRGKYPHKQGHVTLDEAARPPP